MEDKQVRVDFNFSLHKALGVLVIVTLSAVLYFMYTNQKEMYQEREELITVLNDSIVKYKNKEGELVAKISSFETQEVEDFLSLQTKDKEIIELQEEVEKQKKVLKEKGSVTKFQTETSISTESVSTNIGTTEKPKYFSQFNLDGWVVGEATADEFETKLSLRIKNEYNVVVGTEPTGFLGLGKGKAFSEVTNKNPYADVTSLRTYQVSLPKPKKISLGPQVGVKLDLTGVISPYVGFGATYSLIRL